PTLNRILNAPWELFPATSVERQRIRISRWPGVEAGEVASRVVPDDISLGDACGSPFGDELRLVSAVRLIAVVPGDDFLRPLEPAGVPNEASSRSGVDLSPVSRQEVVSSRFCGVQLSQIPHKKSKVIAKRVVVRDSAGSIRNGCDVPRLV